MEQLKPTNKSFGAEDPALPRYEQIKKRILNHIEEDGLKPGDKLPTEAELCRVFGWSRQTIGRALNELAMEGVLTRVRGSGTYVAEKKPIDRPIRIMICDNHLKFEGEYFGPIFAGIREAAARERLDITYYHADIPDSEEIAKVNADGVLLQTPNLEQIPAILRLHETGKPVVSMALRSRFGSLATVCADNLNGMKRAVKYLIDLGHRRLALATPGLTTSDVQERISGFHQACFEGGVPVNPSCLLLFDKAFGNEILESWFDSLSPKPTAIICSANLAFPIQHMLWKRHLRIPEDISLIATDDSELFQNCSPNLTVLRQPLYKMGYRGLAKLTAMLRGDDSGHPEILPMELVTRESVAPARQTEAPVPIQEIP